MISMSIAGYRNAEAFMLDYMFSERASRKERLENIAKSAGSVVRAAYDCSSRVLSPVYRVGKSVVRAVLGTTKDVLKATAKGAKDTVLGYFTVKADADQFASYSGESESWNPLKNTPNAYKMRTMRDYQKAMEAALKRSVPMSEVYAYSFGRRPTPPVQPVSPAQASAQTTPQAGVQTQTQQRDSWYSRTKEATGKYLSKIGGGIKKVFRKRQPVAGLESVVNASDSAVSATSAASVASDLESAVSDQVSLSEADLEGVGEYCADPNATTGIYPAIYFELDEEKLAQTRNLNDALDRIDETVQGIGVDIGELEARRQKLENDGYSALISDVLHGKGQRIETPWNSPQTFKAYKRKLAEEA